MKNSGIYRIQSTIKLERIYIGSAVNINNRWSTHISWLRNNKHPNKKLQNHYSKYGESDLQFSVIEPCLPEFVTIREQSYFNPLPWFNNDPNAFSSLGIKRSEETKRKMSEAHKGQKNHLGFKHSKEAKQKMSEAKKGHEGYWSGKKRSEETIQKMKETCVIRKLKKSA